MAPPLAASSSEDEEVDKQVEEEQKGSAMKKPKSDHSCSDDEEESEESDSEPATPIASKPKKDALKPSSSDPKTSSNDDDDDDDDETPSPKPKPIISKVSSNAKKHPLVSHKDSKLKKKKVLDGNEGDSKLKKKKGLDGNEGDSMLKKKKQKRVLDGNEGDSKLKKKKQKKVFDGNEGKQDKEESEKKKNNVIIQRLWSDEDELVLLKGMIENKKKGGVDPLLNLKEFLESIKKSLQFKEVKQEQLKNKIQRLRRKFVNSSKRAKGDKELVFSKPHEQVSYTLMKEIWGVGGGNSVGVGDGKDDDDDDDDSVVVVNVKRSSSRIMKSQNAAGNPVGTKCNAIPMMDLDDSNGDENAVKKVDLERKWRHLIADELKLYLRRLELVREQTVANIDAHK